jgi:hypothetical protein
MSNAELAALYNGCKLAVPLRTTLKEMGHPQVKRTMVTTDNITTQGLTMGTMTPKASKSMDQCFHWLKCRHAQHQFTYCGVAAPSIAPTTPANIIRPSIIKLSAISTSRTHSHTSKLSPLLQNLRMSLVVDPEIQLQMSYQYTSQGCALARVY